LVGKQPVKLICQCNALRQTKQCEADPPWYGVFNFRKLRAREVLTLILFDFHSKAILISWCFYTGIILKTNNMTTLTEERFYDSVMDIAAVVMPETFYNRNMVAVDNMIYCGFENQDSIDETAQRVIDFYENN
jgi:hypothetical protein